VEDPTRILIVRFSHLGDVVHALCVYHALRDAYPAAEIAWAVQSEFADLVAGLPGLERTIVFERRGGIRAWVRLARSLRNFRADLAVDAQGNLKSAAGTLLSRAPRRVGLARTDQREPLGAFVHTELAPPTPASAPHAIDRMHTLARHVAPGARFPPRHDPAVTPEERRSGEAVLGRLPRGGEAGVVLAVSSPEDVRSWPPASWEALARELGRRGRPVLVLSGPAEAALGAALADRLADAPNVAHEVGQRGLRRLAGLLDLAAQRGMSFVGCDSGPVHVAAACGLPSVVLEGPVDAERTGPWPSRPPTPHRALRASDAPECAPCFSRRCGHPEGPVCMTRIGAEDVLGQLGEPRGKDAGARGREGSGA